MLRRSLCSAGTLLIGTLILVYGTAWGGGLYDGTYHGNLKGDGANAASCAKSTPIQITVTDSKLEYNHMGHALITATVGPDGSFSGSGQNRFAGGPRSMPQVQTLDGKISGGAILAESKVGGACTYKLELRKFN